jgi:hypothetical protein
MKKVSPKIFFLAVLLLLASCGKEMFQANKVDKSTVSNPLGHTSTNKCSEYTLIRPPVDLLFLWDNSTSTNFINNGTKEALTKIVNYMSDRFDYHVVIAPLIGDGTKYFFSRNTMNPSGFSVIDKSQAANVLSTMEKVAGGGEYGASKARDLIRNNINNNVFRTEAYTLVVTLSNDDDTTPYIGINYPIPSYQTYYAQDLSHDLLCLRGNYSGSQYRTSNTASFSRKSTFNQSCTGAPQLNSLMFRYMTIAALDGSRCSSSNINQYTVNKVYKHMSNLIYSESYSNGTASPTDDSFRNKSSSEGVDSFDICLEQYTHIFDGINNAVQDKVVKHVYNFWPVAGLQDSVDESTINVTLNNGVTYNKIADSVTITRDPTGKNDVDSGGIKVTGFRYVGNQTNKDTRFLPSLGEPFTGKMIELFGDAKVTHPACLRVNSSAIQEVLGYCHMEVKPLESSIVVRVNGNVLDTSDWTLLKSGSEPQYTANKNIRIKSASDFSEATPAISKSGYFIRLNSQHVYSNSMSCDVSYLPKN